MSTPCRYAKTCPDRMGYGDLKYGCTAPDERNCGVAFGTSKNSLLDLLVGQEAVAIASKALRMVA